MRWIYVIPVNVFDYPNDKVNIFPQWHWRGRRKKKFVIQHRHFKMRESLHPSDGSRKIVFWGRKRNVWVASKEQRKIYICIWRGGNLICWVACFSERDKNGRVSSKNICHFTIKLKKITKISFIIRRQKDGTGYHQQI